MRSPSISTFSRFSEHDQLELVRFDRAYGQHGFDKAYRTCPPSFEDRILSANAATEEGLHRLALSMQAAVDQWWERPDAAELLAAHVKARGGAA